MANEICHGLGIAQAVDKSTDGAVKLGPGTLYRSLKAMVEAGWIAPAPAPQSDSDPRRRFYRITQEGRHRLRDEAHRMAKWVQVAKDSRVLPDTA